MSSKQNGDDSSRVDAIFSIVVESLAYRRKELLRLALERLPRRVSMALHIESKTILDHEAFWVTQLLKIYNYIEQEFAVEPGVLSPSPSSSSEVTMSAFTGNFHDDRKSNERVLHIIRRYNEQSGHSVYHYQLMNDQTAQKLWEAEFQRIIRPINPYMPPPKLGWGVPLKPRTGAIIRFNHLGNRLVRDTHGQWGATRPRPIPSNRRPHLELSRSAAIHHRPPDGIHDWRITSRKPGHDGRQSEAHLRRWLCDGAHDPCICACSDGGGCTAASLFARGLLGSQWDVVTLDSVLPHIDRIADYASAGGAASTHALDMVRVMTFEVLGLRHTCCQGHWDYRGGLPCIFVLDADSIRRTREEQADELAMLDDLMTEFASQLRGSRTSFVRVLMEVWEPSMRIWEEHRDKLE